MSSVDISLLEIGVGSTLVERIFLWEVYTVVRSVVCLLDYAAPALDGREPGILEDRQSQVLM